SLPNLFLIPKIHLHRARGLKVGCEQALLAAQCLCECRSFGRIRAERGVGSLKLLLQTDDSGSNAAHRIAADLGGVESVRRRSPRHNYEPVGRTWLIRLCIESPVRQTGKTIVEHVAEHRVVVIQAESTAKDR